MQELLQNVPELNKLNTDQKIKFDINNIMIQKQLNEDQKK